jgi:hypothetical protein
MFNINDKYYRELNAFYNELFMKCDRTMVSREVSVVGASFKIYDASNPKLLLYTISINYICDSILNQNEAKINIRAWRRCVDQIAEIVKTKH